MKQEANRSLETQRIFSESEAAALIRAGKLVAFPTETVFGLGAAATQPAAIRAIFAAKGRPADNPLIVHLSAVADWSQAASRLPQSAQILLAEFAPGPLTVIVPKHPSIDSLVTAGLETVAIRIPECAITRSILSQAELPVAAPSANRSGKPSCTTWQSVLEDLDGIIDAVLCKNYHSLGLESTVVDCTREAPIVLRPGAVTLDAIREFCPDARSAAVQNGAASPGPVASPGVRHPHYQPNAQVYLFESEEELEELLSGDRTRLAGCGLETMPHVQSCVYWQAFDSLDAYAAGFYEFLREADRRGAQGILVQLAGDRGLGCALRDRQLRAAGRAAQ